MPESPFDIADELMLCTVLSEEEKDRYRRRLADAIKATVIAYAGKTAAGHYTNLIREDEEC